MDLLKGKKSGDFPIMKKSTYHYFFSHNLKKYIDQHIYQLKNSQKIFEVIKSIDSVTCRRWEKIPLSYLSSNEALGLGIILAFDNAGERLSRDHVFERVSEYFLWTLENAHKSQDVYHLACTCLGVICLEKALIESKKRQRKYLILARHYLEESQERLSRIQKPSLSIHLEVNFIYQTLVEVCLNNLPEAIKNLQKAAKISKNSAPLWKMLANIYKNLGMPCAQNFFHARYEKATMADAPMAA